MLINLSQAYKWSSDQQNCLKVIEKKDLSLCANHIQLAVSLLRDDYATALELIKKIGKSQEIKEHDYRDWPIFKKLRKRRDFLDVYNEIHGCPFAPEENIVAKIQSHPKGINVELSYQQTVDNEIE